MTVATISQSAPLSACNAQAGLSAAAQAGLSLRAYARHRKARGLDGGTHEAVRYAIKTGRITALPDGRIDPEQADAQWEQTTSPRATAIGSHPVQGARRLPALGRQAGAHPAVSRSVQPPTFSEPTLGSGASSLGTARAIREQFLARLAKLEYEERVGKLISRDEVQVAEFNATRIIRDGLQNIPDRVCGAITSEIAAAVAAAGLPADVAQTIDLARVHAIISAEVRNALGDTADSLTRRAGSL